MAAGLTAAQRRRSTGAAAANAPPAVPPPGRDVGGSEPRARRPPTLLRQPVETCRLFGEVCAATLSRCVRWLVWRGRAASYGVLALVCALVVAHSVPGAHTAALVEAREYASAAAWWLGLGVLSSIGLGTGLHSGMLFLFPHIAKVCHSAEACCSVGFDSRRNIWFGMSATELFPCALGVRRACEPGEVTYAQLLLKALPPSLLWGMGTALGEVPPYLLARAAARASKANLVASGRGAISGSGSLLERTKAWMEHVLRRRGFWGLVALSAWPNSLFDFVGVCCGHFGMRFSTFLGGTLLGKGVIKASWQAALFTMAFSTPARTVFVARVGHALDRVLPASLQASQRLQQLALNLPARLAAGVQVTTGGTHLSLAWSAAMTLLVAFFAVSCVEQLAQARQADIDAAAARPL